MALEDNTCEALSLHRPARHQACMPHRPTRHAGPHTHRCTGRGRGPQEVNGNQETKPPSSAEPVWDGAGEDAWPLGLGGSSEGTSGERGATTDNASQFTGQETPLTSSTAWATSPDTELTGRTALKHVTQSPAPLLRDHGWENRRRAVPRPLLCFPHKTHASCARAHTCTLTHVHTRVCTVQKQITCRVTWGREARRPQAARGGSDSGL